jgi:hypothetical protein
MARYVLKLKEGAAQSDADAIRRLAGVRVLDDVGGKALLVEMDPDVLERHGPALNGWTVGAETTYALPEQPSEKIRQ